MSSCISFFCYSFFFFFWFSLPFCFLFNFCPFLVPLDFLCFFLCPFRSFPFLFLSFTFFFLFLSLPFIFFCFLAPLLPPPSLPILSFPFPSLRFLCLPTGGGHRVEKKGLRKEKPIFLTSRSKKRCFGVENKWQKRLKEKNWGVKKKASRCRNQRGVKKEMLGVKKKERVKKKRLRVKKKGSPSKIPG